MSLTSINRYFFNSVLYFFLFFTSSNFYSYASEKNNNQTNPINKISKSSTINSEGANFIEEYILDSGDVLEISFQSLDIFSNKYSIDRAGYIKLPEIGFYFVRGKTVSQIINDLKIKYKEFIYEPDIIIDIATFRAVKIFISGEINNPGFYNMNNIDEENSSSNNVTISIEGTKKSSSSLKFPKLFNAIKAAGGVTNYADLSKIEVIRNNPLNYGGGKKRAEINLLDLIFKGNQENNIHIYDDDVINIPKSDKLIKDQFLAINKINLNPNFINIYFSGEVIRAGSRRVKKGSSLNKAIASNGGKKLLSGKIEFIRFNNEGDIERRLIRYDSSAKVETFSNPLLIEGDIINIKRTPIGLASDTLRIVSPPILNSYVLLNLFGDN